MYTSACNTYATNQYCINHTCKDLQVDANKQICCAIGEEGFRRPWMEHIDQATVLEFCG